MKQSINNPKFQSLELKKLIKRRNELEERISDYKTMYECEKNSKDEFTLNFYLNTIKECEHSLSLVEKDIAEELEKDFELSNDYLKEFIKTTDDKYTLSRYIDNDFMIPRSSGYFGTYFVAQIYDKYILVYIDSNEYDITFVSDFYDEIQYGSEYKVGNNYHTFSTDLRWGGGNENGVIIVKQNGLYNVLSQKGRTKFELVHNEWFKNMQYTNRERISRKEHITATMQDDKEVYLDYNGYIVRNNDELLNQVSKWSKEEILDNWVKKGKLVVGGHGFQYKGGGTNVIPNDIAEQKFPNYSFGMGFYELSWVEYKGEVALSMREYSENDMY
jgi:hypothetical protein